MTETNVFQLYLPEREIMTGIATVSVRCPRVRDRLAKAPTHPFFLGDPAALRAPIEESRSADSDPLPKGHFHW